MPASPDRCPRGGALALQTHPPGSLRGPVLGQPCWGSPSILQAPPHAHLRDMGPQQPPSAVGRGRGCLQLSPPLPPRARLSRRSGVGGRTAAPLPHGAATGLEATMLRGLRPLQLSPVTVTTRRGVASHPTAAPSNPLLLSKGFSLRTSGIFVHTGLQREAADQGLTGRSRPQGH